MRRLPVYTITTIIFIAWACNSQDYTPKPSGYLRTDFPEKEYLVFDQALPYTFEYPKYGIIKNDTSKGAEPYWINIEFPDFKAKIHLSYKKVNGKADNFEEDARKLAYKHTIKADAIEESVIEDKANAKFGILYDIEGNTASAIQFYVSDYRKNFLRGALYFSSSPNKDSLSPSIAFFRKDIEHLITSLRWKN